MGPLFWWCHVPGPLPAWVSPSARLLPSSQHSPSLLCLPVFGFWVRIPRCWSGPSPPQPPKAAVHPSRPSLGAHCPQQRSQSAGDGEVLAGGEAVGMDTEALSGVPCPPRTSRCPKVAAEQDGNLGSPSPGGLCRWRFSLQGAGEQRSHFLTETTCERRGNAKGADLKENMLTM